MCGNSQYMCRISQGLRGRFGYCHGGTESQDRAPLRGETQ